VSTCQEQPLLCLHFHCVFRFLGPAIALVASFFALFAADLLLRVQHAAQGCLPEANHRQCTSSKMLKHSGTCSSNRHVWVNVCCLIFRQVHISSHAHAYSVAVGKV